MADFCYDCTVDLLGPLAEPDYARRNDMVGAEGGWCLCEGCGFHRFSDDGRRYCVTAPHEEDVTMEPCQACLELEL